MNSTISRLARVIAIALVITGLLVIRAGQFIWAHRREIRDAAITAYAAIRLAAEWVWERRAAVRAAALAVHAAGGVARVELEAVSARAAELVHSQPLPALAPIVAPVLALREALERLVAAIYPAAAA
jgi:hypothetical protein